MLAEKMPPSKLSVKFFPISPCLLACKDVETRRHVLAAKMPPSVRILSASCEAGLCASVPLCLCASVQKRFLYRPTSVPLPGPVASHFCLCSLLLSYKHLSKHGHPHSLASERKGKFYQTCSFQWFMKRFKYTMIFPGLYASCL